jgi:hypothetical protein
VINYPKVSNSTPIESSVKIADDLLYEGMYWNKCGDCYAVIAECDCHHYSNDHDDDYFDDLRQEMKDDSEPKTE